MGKIRWVFWDIGDTLINEDQLRYHIYERLLATIRRVHPSVTFDDLLVWRAELIACGDTSPHYTIARRELPSDAYAEWEEATRRFVETEGQNLLIPVPDAHGVLARLTRWYTLGVIADQPPVVEETLRRMSLRRWFDLIALGHDKADGTLFRRALDLAGCAPKEAAMVGNRLDTDIAPAQRLGMRAIFCYLSPKEKGWEPQTEHGRRYLDAITIVPNWPTEPQLRPNARIKRLTELERVLERWR